MPLSLGEEPESVFALSADEDRNSTDSSFVMIPAASRRIRQQIPLARNWGYVRSLRVQRFIQCLWVISYFVAVSLGALASNSATSWSRISFSRSGAAPNQALLTIPWLSTYRTVGVPDIL